MYQLKSGSTGDDHLIFGPDPDDRSSSVRNLPEYYEEGFPKAEIDDLIRGASQHVEIEFRGKRVFAIRLPGGRYVVAYTALTRSAYIPHVSSTKIHHDRVTRVMSVVAIALAAGAIAYVIDGRGDMQNLKASLALQMTKQEASILKRDSCLNGRLDALTTNVAPSLPDTAPPKKGVSAIQRRMDDLTRSVSLLEKKLDNGAATHVQTCQEISLEKR